MNEDLRAVLTDAIQDKLGEAAAIDAVEVAAGVLDTWWDTALRAPFEPEQIGKLPRVTCGNCRDSNTKVCQQHQKGRCEECGAWISSAHIHLDYVGHAATTDRLRQVDPWWNWEPFALDADGLPKISVRGRTATMWIRLTVAGVTRPGVGSADSNKAELEKELIGDALRNGAMRFGVALDLWSKEDLHAAEDDATATTTERPRVETRDQGPPIGPEEQPTSRGNTRRGPRVLEGWADIEEQRLAHEHYQARGKEAPEDVRDAIKAWTKERGYGWPMTREQLESADAEMTRLRIGTPGVEPAGSCPNCEAPLGSDNQLVDLEHCQMCEAM